MNKITARRQALIDIAEHEKSIPAPNKLGMTNYFGTDNWRVPASSLDNKNNRNLNRDLNIHIVNKIGNKNGKKSRK
jgi:hypothetical protein